MSTTQARKSQSKKILDVIQDVMGGKAKAKAPPLASEEPMEPMLAAGNADNTIKAAANHLKIGNSFVIHVGNVNSGLSPRLGADYLKVPEAEAMTEYFFGLLASYLASVYISPPGTTNSGQHLSSSTAEIYFNALLNMQKERFRLSPLPQSKVRALACTLLRSARACHLRAHACNMTQLLSTRVRVRMLMLTFAGIHAVLQRAFITAGTMAGQDQASDEQAHLPARLVWQREDGPFGE